MNVKAGILGVVTWKERGLRRRLRHHQAAKRITVCHDPAVSCLRYWEGLLEVVFVLPLAGRLAAQGLCLRASGLL